MAFFFPSPLLGEGGADLKAAPDEGFYPRIEQFQMREPLPRWSPLTRLGGFASKPPSPTGRGSAPYQLQGVIETGEKSTNQLFGCTKPLTFGLIARGATSWAT